MEGDIREVVGLGGVGLCRSHLLPAILVWKKLDVK